ncbi:hypothetical protein [Shewanella sp. YLB-07]|uniref:hypothetical protein n=1 Tax=Shewanella sp. YLB-07 TaxID=2601268 RepID=UPI001D154E68|nr:hypothetical protein [Shewanella sp. YLB-07]
MTPTSPRPAWGALLTVKANLRGAGLDIPVIEGVKTGLFTSLFRELWMLFTGHSLRATRQGLLVDNDNHYHV